MHSSGEVTNHPDYVSKDILWHVRRFVSGANQKGLLKSGELVKSALFLLQNLPSAHCAVLEHLCVIFDEAVQAHILHMRRSELDVGKEDWDVIIQNVHNVLLSFIKSNPEAWSPIISAWSLKLLGVTSSKYSQRQGVMQASSLNESLQLWMTCKATMVLMDIATECFASMIASSPDICVDALLEASVVHSPHFDWVVAHIGSCFPTMIITRVLMCGLKDFCRHSNGDNEQLSSHGRLPKMTTVVGILGHLASQHGQDIRKALLNLFEESLTSDNDVMHLSTIPFLLQIASLSPLLLKVIANEFVHSLTPSVLNQLAARFTQTQIPVLQDKTGLLNLTVQLIIKANLGSLKVIMFLLQTAAPDADCQDKVNETVQKTCASILDHVMGIIYAKTHSKKDEYDIPLLSALENHTLDLCQALFEGTDLRCKWISRLLVSLAAYCGQGCAAQILSYGFTHATSKNKLAMFVKLQKEMETQCQYLLMTAITHCMETIGKGDSVEQASRHSHKRRRVETSHLLVNLLTLVRVEKSEKYLGRASIQKVLQKHILTFATLLTSQQSSVAIAAIQIMNLIGLPETCDMSQIIHLCGAVVTFFFHSLQIKSFGQKSKASSQCIVYLQKLTQLTPAMNIILRFLMDGIFMEENSQLFGAKIYAQSSSQDIATKLVEDNRKLSISVTLPQSHSTVFHAGVIGKGLKRPPRPSIITKDQITVNRQLLISAMLVTGTCSIKANGSNEHHHEGDEHSATVKPVTISKPKLSTPASHVLAMSLVQLTTPDVLYNDVGWPAPDQFLMKQTVERDLKIKKRFEDFPVLWDILEVVSTSKSGLIICSCLLRSLTATLIQYWDSYRGNSTRDAPWYLEASCKIIDALKKGEILQKPMCYMSEMFHLITPYQLYLLLLSVWEYLFQCPEVLDCEYNPDSGNPLLKMYYTNAMNNMQLNSNGMMRLCRNIIHSNIELLGPLYGRFFSCASNATRNNETAKKTKPSDETKILKSDVDKKNL